MRERINRLARGIIENEQPRLVLQPERIEGTLLFGEKTRGTFFVQSMGAVTVKGLIYSDNPRVVPCVEVFAGGRCRVAYEADAAGCEHGEWIRGSFYLVTNAGEKEIPYSLRVQNAGTGDLLESLKTADDFARLAQKNEEQALELFERADFINAPFLHDLSVQTLYEGLKGRTNRRSLLEEFLVALGVKEPVRIYADCEQKTFHEIEGDRREMLTLFVSGWGYASATFTTDAPFLELETSQITDCDFSNGAAQIAYRIKKKRLHGGKNVGVIRILAGKETKTVTITVKKTHRTERERAKWRADQSLLSYERLRLAWELGDQAVYEEMEQELARLKEERTWDCLAMLLEAERALLMGRVQTAASILDECRAQKKDRDQYLFYQYLQWCVTPEERRAQGLAQMLRESLLDTQGRADLRLLLLIKVDSSIRQNALELWLRMKGICHGNAKSPFLYVEACRLLETHRGLFASLEAFELQVLIFGLKHSLISQETAQTAAKLARNLPMWRKSYERLLISLYQTFPGTELLDALCRLLILGDRREPDAFSWYHRALRENINPTKLYEYLLYSMPDGYRHLLPKAVLLYFSYQHNLDAENQKKLYRNILCYMNPQRELYATYVRSMEQFALGALFERKIDGALAEIYSHLIYPDMVDERVAKVLPDILKTWRIDCLDARAQYVVVRRGELSEEVRCPIHDNTAWVPLWGTDEVLFLEDAKGNRLSSLSCVQTPVMERSDLLEACRKRYPDHPMFRLKMCREILEHGIHSREEAMRVRRVLREQPLGASFSKKLSRLWIDYVCRLARLADTDPSDSAWLLRLLGEAMDPAQYVQVCNALICRGNFREAYELIRQKKTDAEKLEPKLLAKLVSRIIFQNVFGEEKLLLDLAWQVFLSGESDGVILDYLCEHFNGTCAQMYRIFTKAEEVRCPMYDLKERLLAQMMFTGNVDQIDAVFWQYAAERDMDPGIYRAYLTVKSIQYFLERKDVDEQFFSYLESIIRQSKETEKVPTIYLLALTLYYSRQELLSERQLSLCRMIADLLIQEELVFPYTKDLARHIAIPESILDKTMVEYIGERDESPEISVRVRPGEAASHTEPMVRVYQGIFVYQCVLFDGETMECEVSSERDGKSFLAFQRTIPCEPITASRKNSRYALLNEMSRAQKDGDAAALEAAMESYLENADILAQLFGIS